MENNHSLRPKKLENFIGQENIKEQIAIHIESAKIREENLNHFLFYGPAGLGKTSLAKVISEEMGGDLHVVLATSIKEKYEVLSILLNLKKGDFLFIDEIQSLPRELQEMFYSAMEDFNIELQVNEEFQTIQFEPFTLIGATTNLSKLTKPMRDRFYHVYKLEYYSISELEKIIEQMASLKNNSIEKDACFEIAIRSKKTPRVAIRYLLTIRNFELSINKSENIKKETVLNAFKRLGVDELGLTAEEREVLKSMLINHNDKPVGPTSLSMSANIEEEDFLKIIEPFLIQQNLIIRGKRGRTLTDLGREHIKKHLELISK